jgi:hypothetical protein
MNLISPFIQSQLPKTIQDNYPNFVTFITAYYAWLEQTDNVYGKTLNLLSDSDLDSNVDIFLAQYTIQYLQNIPEYVLVNKPFLIKHIREFYQEKGSENSYKFLFRILFNVDVTFYYPDKDVLRVSSGHWIVNRVIRTTSYGNTFNLPGTYIVGEISGASALVDKVIQFYDVNSLITTETPSDDIQGIDDLGLDAMGGDAAQPIVNPITTFSELYLKNISGNFIAGESFINEVTEETILPLLIGVKIVNPGSKYSVNDKVVINSSTGQGTKSIIRIKTLFGSEFGRVTESSINTLGLDYRANTNPDFYIGRTITILSGNGANQTRTITNYTGSNDVTGLDILGISLSGNESGICTLDQNWTTIPNVYDSYRIDLGKILSLEVLDPGLNYAYNGLYLSLTQLGDGTAQILPIIGTIFSYPGYWENSEGFLSSNPKVQDSYFYQAFSYELKTSISSDTYKNPILDLVHPSGTIMFGKTEIIHEFYSGSSVTSIDINKLDMINGQGIQEYVTLSLTDFQLQPNNPSNMQVDTTIYINGTLYTS